VLGSGLSRHILVGDTINFEIAEKPYVFVILTQSDLKHVIIETSLLPPLVVLIFDLIVPDPFYGLERDAY
jgi:hypothetical protein